MSKKIMVVDDEPDIIFTVKTALEEAEEKYEIISAGSGEECLELLENNRIPDLILLDIMMPEMSGWVLYYHIKDNPSWEKIPVVFLTARADKTSERTGKSLGDDFIKNPFDGEDLKNRINKVLEKRQVA